MKRSPGLQAILDAIFRLLNITLGEVGDYMVAGIAEELDKESVVQVLTRKFDQFSKSEQKVAQRIMQSPKGVAGLNVAQLAEMCQVSDATVVRLCQRAGYSGYYELRIYLMRDLDSEGHDDSFMETDPISYSLNRDLLLLKTINNRENSKAVGAAADLIVSAPIVYIAAIGNTTPLANDLEFRLNSLGIRAFTAEKIESQLRYLPNAQKEDMLIVISKSGESLGVSKLVGIAREKGMKIISVTSAGVSPLSKESDIVISSGQESKIFDKIKPRVESHLAEFYLLDALVFQVDIMLREHGDAPSGEELELALSFNKM